LRGVGYLWSNRAGPEEKTQESSNADLEALFVAPKPVKELHSGIFSVEFENSKEEFLMDSSQERIERFIGASKIREILDAIKEKMIMGTLSNVAYEAYLLEVEELMISAAPKYAEVWVLIQEELGEEFVQMQVEGLSDDALLYVDSWTKNMLRDVGRTFGFVWGQTEPEQSLNFVKVAGPSVLSGWLAAQMYAENDYPTLLASQKVSPSAEVYWEALMEIAKTDTVLSLDTIMANHMGEMDLNKWRQILFSQGNSGDTILGAWFEENISILSEYPSFEEAEIIRMLRRANDGGGPFMVSEEIARVDAATSANDYEGAARIMEELSASYEDTIDASAVGSFIFEWSMQDFAAASSWLLQNADKFSDSESMESMLSTMYRRQFSEDAELGLQLAHQIEDESLKAKALSNMVIPQLENLGTEAPVDWVSDLPQGIAKKRSMAGYVLGLSRYTKETKLEAQVKFQFLQDKFDLELIQKQVLESNLSSIDKISVFDFLNTY